MKQPWATWCLAVWLAGFALLQPARANEQATLDSAIFLLREATQVRRNGQHHQMLNALRQIAEPDMLPLFEHLAASDVHVLRVHGLLGMAEADPEHHLDLVRIANIEDPVQQADVISAALDNELIDEDVAEQMLKWKRLDDAAKILLTSFLLQHGRQVDLELLREQAQSPLLGRRSLVNLLLLEAGHPEALKQLEALNQSDKPERDLIRSNLLQTAMRHEFSRCGPWAMSIARELGNPGAGAGVNPALGRAALGVALRFGTPGAEDLWREQFKATDDPILKAELGMMALELSPWLEPAFFRPLLASPDKVLGKFGQAGQAVASHKNVGETLASLVPLNIVRANQWILRYVRKYADPADARVVLKAVIENFDGPSRNQAQRFDDAVEAARILAETDLQAARQVLVPMLENPDVSDTLQQGILLGLLRCRQVDPYPIIEGLAPSAQPRVNGYRLILMARHGRRLSEPQLKELALLVRGGGMFSRPLRLQAAWSWLRLTGKTTQALDEALQS